jgi:hypothetical protein
MKAAKKKSLASAINFDQAAGPSLCFLRLGMKLFFGSQFRTESAYQFRSA